ncbi:MAG: XRE family transcriptional regulator [Burkholderiales bacterium]|nr:MAG: XRE family transcriptional regulator [Burkholderiales bacterium]
MPATLPLPNEQTQAQLTALGEQIRARRKALKVSATVAAEAAGLSRVTLHRIEKGEPSVTMGAWANVCTALGMEVAAQLPNVRGATAPAPDLSQWIPARVRLADYPQLKALAWQVSGVQTLSPLEAHSIYERNARHLDQAALLAHEQALMQALNAAFGSAIEVTNV